MTELGRSIAGAALWVGVLTLFTAAANRAVGRRALDAQGLLVAYPAFTFAGIAGIKLVDLVYRLDTAGAVGLYLLLGTVAAVLLRVPPRAAAAGDNSTTPLEDVADTMLVRRVAVLTAGLAVAALALFALVTPVHVWDVQAYHMPMVASYVQNESLAVWPAQDLRQVYRVNGGELQMLTLALFARSDAWVELPNVVALFVAFVATLHIGRRILGREILAWVAALLLLTAPQILLGAVTAKNDLVFMALVLCAFYWTIDVISAPARPLAARLVLLGGIGALTVATKVMGLNVVGAIGLVLLLFVVRRRVPLRAPALFGVCALLGVAILVGDIYWQNFTRSQDVPVGTMPGEVWFTSGLSNLRAAAHFYLYDLSFRRLITEQRVEHDFGHYGYFFPIILVLGTWAAVRPLFTRRAPEPPLAALGLLVLVLFASVIAVRQPIGWDQRFMIWLVPSFAILAARLLHATNARHLVVLASFAAAFALGNLFRTFSDASDALFVRSASHLLRNGEPAALRDVPQERYLFKIDGYAALDHAAGARDSILYVGAEDTWMYPAWGRRFSRHVRGVAGRDDAVRELRTRAYRFVVVEDDAAEELRGETLSAAADAGYTDLVAARGRRILRRSGAAEAGRDE